MVKNLGVYLNEELHWNKKILHIIVQITGAIGILSKLQHNVSLKTLKMVYHSLFGS